MTSSKRIVLVILAGTLLLLAYVHEHIAIFRVSYAIEKKEREAAYLNEAYKNAKFRVLKLRSPEALNERAKVLSLDLTAPTDQTLVRILKVKAIPEGTKLTWSAPLRFLSWVQMIKEAHAKTSKE